MKKIKKIGIVLMALVAIVAIAIGIFTYTLKPTYEGETQLDHLSDNVEVYYDAYGIPHIYGTSDADAFRALGFVHAQDRLWQMELLRRIGTGRLSEVFGEDLLTTDKFFLSLGIDEATSKTVAELDMNSEAVLLSQAYLDGVNQFIENGPTPIEFYLTGIDKTPFSITDIHNTLGYMSFSFAQAHKTDPLLTRLKDKLGSPYLKDLAIDSDTTTVFIQNHNTRAENLPSNLLISEVSKSLQAIHIPLFEGSNSWVLGPNKTKNKQVIFANDPHIGFAQPSVWYEAHVQTPSYERYGYHLAGVPFPLLAHDRNLAYGMTMFQNDDVDFYYEELNPEDSTQYKTVDGWKNFEIVTKKIKVKDAPEVEFTFNKSIRGPVLNGIANQVSGKSPIAMWWAYTRNKNEVIEALFEMASATDIGGLQKALPKIHAPGLNIMYGDAKGNIAWWATAKLYETPDSVHTKFIIENASSFPIDRAYLPFSENPQAINPPWNFVYSANNQPDTINGKLYPGYYLPENRAKRIVKLLAPKNDWDKNEVEHMITDVTSAVDPVVLNNFIMALDLDQIDENDSEILDRLRAWNGEHELESVEATIFHRWEFEVMQKTFLDEMGTEDFQNFINTHLSKRSIAPLSNNSASIWWDDVNTSDTNETQTEIVQMAFNQALQSLRNDFGDDVRKWTWNKVHTLEHEHPIGKVAALRSFFNVGPFSINGSREVINNLYFPYTTDGFYKVSSGPSTRRVIDFSDIENSTSILPTGQSGNPFSKYYKNQAEMYNNGQFRKMMMNKKEIIDNADGTLLLKKNL